MLRYGIEESRLPRSVLDAEIAVVARLGAGLRAGVTVGKEVALDDLRRDFDAVVVAVGAIHRDEDRLGLAGSPTTIHADHKTRQTSLAGVFAAGDAAGRHGMAIRSIADGKTAAAAVDQYLSGIPVEGIKPSFSVHIAHLHDGEIDRFMPGANAGPRNKPGPDGGLSLTAGGDEAARCLHCDCRKPHCKLRRASEKLGARKGQYKVQRRLFEQDRSHKAILYESGKCIACGLCIQIAQKHGEKLGLTFIGRGFDVRVAVPFDGSLAEALTVAAAQCATACPTGALVLRDDHACGSGTSK
jgi:ferredoxin